jgi:hypothetical protein
MSTPYNAASQFPGTAQYATKRFLGAFTAKPLVMPIQPWWRPKELTAVLPGAKLETFLNVPIHKPGLSPWTGAWQFDEQSNLFMSVKRGVYTKGAKVNMIRASEMDFGGWSSQPETIAIEIGNNPGNLLVALLNAAFTSVDQIYGGNVAVLTGGTKKHVNPADPSVGDDWFNAHENFDITADNFLTAITNMQKRQAMNGVELGIGDEGLEVWVPFGSKERARLIFEVMRELVNAGYLGTVDLTSYQTDTGGTPKTNEQVIFGNSQNPVFGRARVVGVHGMRSDMWTIVSPPPAGGAMPHLGMFLYAHGGNVGSYAIMTDPNALNTDTVPHIAMFEWGMQSPLFFGMPGVSVAGDIGISALINEGVAWASGLLAEFCYTSSAS